MMLWDPEILRNQYFSKRKWFIWLFTLNLLHVEYFTCSNLILKKLHTLFCHGLAFAVISYNLWDLYFIFETILIIKRPSKWYMFACRNNVDDKKVTFDWNKTWQKMIIFIQSCLAYWGICLLKYFTFLCLLWWSMPSTKKVIELII